VAGRSVDLAVRIAVDAQQAGAEMEQAASGASSFGDKIGKMAVPAAAAGAAIVAFGKGAVEAASSVQQGLGAVGSVFGDNAAQVTAWSENAAQSAGLAQSSYLEMASKIGAQLNNMGVSADQATQGTDQLITMGADLAATFGGSTADAVDALGAAMKGEADSAEKYGLNLSASAVAAQMAADCTDKLQGSAFTAAKAQTIMAMATKQSGQAVGAFAREADTAEGASARASAQWENTQATLGQVLLPVVTAVSQALGDLAKFMQDNATATQIVIGVIGVLAVAILAVSVASKVYAAGVAVVTAAQWAWNAAMSANPVMLVVLAVAALVAGIVILWNKSDAFRSFVIGMWEAIQAAALTAWNAIQNVVSSVVNAIRSAIDAAGNTIENVWNTVKSVATSVWNGIKSLVSSVVDGIVSAVQGIIGAITGAWNSMRSAAETAWNAIRSLVSTVTGAIVSIVSGIQDSITAVWTTIQRAGEAVWKPIQHAAEAAMGVITGAINKVMDAVRGIGSAIQSAIGWAGDLLGKILGAGNAAAAVPGGTSVQGFAAVSAPAPSLARSGLLTPATRAANGSGGGGTTIVVNGALDPDAVARQIASILRGRGRRAGGIVL
jgi:hypothetical protein